MTIQFARFVKGIRGTDDVLYDGIPQIVFAGRSNVGKSSLINSLVGRKSLARSSSNPGKTVNLDFFLVNEDFYFVDLPGYGYANVGAKRKEDIRKMVHWYFTGSEVKHSLVILILDIKVGITDFDRDMISTCQNQNIPFVIIANKVDKLKMGEQEKLVKPIIDQSKGAVNVIPYSTFSGVGKDTLLKTIFERLR
jgi:GTP-binding protein